MGLNQWDPCQKMIQFEITDSVYGLCRNIRALSGKLLV